MAREVLAVIAQMHQHEGSLQSQSTVTPGRQWVRVNEPHLTNHQLMEYSKRLLSEEEASRVREHLGLCSDCRFQFRAVVRAQELLRASKQPHLQDSKTNPSRARQNGYMVGRAALVIGGLAAVLLILMLLPRGEPPPSSEYWMPMDPVTSSFRELASPESDILDNALHAYSRRDANETLELLKSIEGLATREGDLGVYIRVLRCSALVNSGQQTAALEELEKLQPRQMEHLSGPWQARLGWVRYLAYRDSGQHDSACEILRWLQVQPDDLSDRVVAEMARGVCGSGR